MANPELKFQFPNLVSGPELLQRQAEEPKGLPTGFADLDQRLLWQGIPRGGLSLFLAPPGLGATTLWLQTARQLQEKKRWSLWISNQTTLFPPALWTQGLDLQFLYVARTPEQSRDQQFLLREALESQIFTLIGCEVESLRSLRRSLFKLKTLAEKSKAAFVFLSSDPRDLTRTHDMNWVVEFQPQSLIVHKAKNRPSFSLPWRGPYANLLSQLSPTGASLHRGGFPEVHTPPALSGTGPSLRGHPADPVAVQKFEKPA
jgi:hypothetical protein